LAAGAAFVIAKTKKQILHRCAPRIDDGIASQPASSGGNAVHEVHFKKV
jgi:hypothetical protein